MPAPSSFRGLLAGGHRRRRRRPRRRHRSRVRAWRTSRERIADAPTRLAALPPRRRSRHTRTSLILLSSYFVLRASRYSFLLYDVLVLLYSYVRVAARIIAFVSHFVCNRRAAALSVNVRRFPAVSRENLFLLLLATRKHNEKHVRSHSLESR